VGTWGYSLIYRPPTSDKNGWWMIDARCEHPTWVVPGNRDMSKQNWESAVVVPNNETRYVGFRHTE
jgi:hypothetical protein